MTTYALFVQRVARLVADPEVSRYSEEIYWDAICAAHDAVLPWLPNYEYAELTSGSLGYALPDDVYDIQSVRIGTGNYIPRATLSAGTNRPTSITACDWIETPKGYLSLSAAESIEDTVSIHYLGYWPKPASATSNSHIITVPSCAHQGMVYYAASIVITPVVVDISTLGPFKIRVESGTPEDNPMMRTSEWFRNLFLQEMKMMPPYQKAKA